MRPRQARYQAALRPDRLCVLIIRDFATRMLSNGPIRPTTAPKLPEGFHWTAAVPEFTGISFA